MKSQSPASLHTFSLCHLGLLRYLALQMAPFFSQLPFFYFILGFYLLWLCWIFLSSFWVFPSQLKCWICMCLFSTFFFVFLLPGQSYFHPCLCLLPPKSVAFPWKKEYSPVGVKTPFPTLVSWLNGCGRLRKKICNSTDLRSHVYPITSRTVSKE